MRILRGIWNRAGDGELPTLPDCSVCGGPQDWFDVTGVSRLVPGETAVEIVALCCNEECERGPSETAARMGWGRG